MALTWDEDKGQWVGGPAVADVTGTVGATYTATEQGILSACQNRINALLAALRDAGIIALD